MKLLLDTHTLIWFLEGIPKLSSFAKDLIAESLLAAKESEPKQLRDAFYPIVPKFVRG
jgi:hypothetical protein